MLGLSACSETEDEETTEFGNWKARNDAYFAALEDSLRLGSDWMKFKSFTKDETTAGQNTDYIYVHVLATGDGTECPIFSDSVRVAYRGCYIPSQHYPTGYVFDQTYVGSYDLRTTSTRKFFLTNGSLVDGFMTALLHMHKGDRWLVFMPYQLGYGASDFTPTVNGVAVGQTIPGGSNLIFDLTLIDLTHPGTSMPVWGARKR